MPCHTRCCFLLAPPALQDRTGPIPATTNLQFRTYFEFSRKDAMVPSPDCMQSTSKMGTIIASDASGQQSHQKVLAQRSAGRAKIELRSLRQRSRNMWRPGTKRDRKERRRERQGLRCHHKLAPMKVRFCVRDVPGIVLTGSYHSCGHRCRARTFLH